jgi:hypothetical protein
VRAASLLGIQLGEISEGAPRMWYLDWYLRKFAPGIWRSEI